MHKKTKQFVMEINANNTDLKKYISDLTQTECTDISS